MSNIANIQKLYYCDHRNGRCAKIAEHQVKLCKRGEEKDAIHLSYVCEHRCEEHKSAGTTGKKVFDIKPLDQSWTLQEVNRFLRTLIGKTIVSKFHSARGLEVKYMGKMNNAGLMCWQPISRKWKYVYYHQVESVFEEGKEPHKILAEVK